MTIFIRLFSAVITSLPAVVCWLIISKAAGDEYYWPAYLVTGGTFLVASFLIGFCAPGLFPSHWKRHPILWLFVQGLLAWLVAELVFGVANFTPLCIGQDNGDGNNDIGLCMAQTVMMSIVYSPLEFILLFLTTIPGGWLIKKTFKSEAT
jgi:hypothetical protein